jgi:hypothetical protein
MQIIISLLKVILFVLEYHIDVNTREQSRKFTSILQNLTVMRICITFIHIYYFTTNTIIK